MKTAGEVVHVNGTATDNGDIIFDVVSAVLWTALTPLVITASVFMLLVLHRSEKDTTHLFLVTINVNILVSCFAFALPVTISSFAGGEWVLGSVFCTAESLFLMYMHFQLALLSLSYALEQLVFVRYPLHHAGLVTGSRVRRLVVCILVLPLLMIPLSGYLSEWRGVYVPSFHACAPYSEPPLSKAIFVTLCLLLSVVPSVTGYIVHLTLLFTARHHLRRIIAEIPRPVLSRDDTGGNDHRQQVAEFGRKIWLNKAQFIFLSILSPLTLALFVSENLALFGFPVPKYLVLFSSTFGFTISVLFVIKTMFKSITLKQTARRLFKCC